MARQRSHNHSIQFSRLAKPPGLRPMTKAATKYYVFRWKDRIDASAPLWKRVFYWCLYRPFNQFCRFKLGIPTFNAEEHDECGCKKRLLWTEHQGIVDEKWQAEQAAESPLWGYHCLPYNALLPARSVAPTDHNYPLADVKTQDRYQRNGHSTVGVPKLDLVKLAAKVSSTDSLVEML